MTLDDFMTEVDLVRKSKLHDDLESMRPLMDITNAYLDGDMGTRSFAHSVKGKGETCSQS